MPTRRATTGLLCLAALFAAALLLCHYQLVRNEYCARCVAHRSVTQWRLCARPLGRLGTPGIPIPESPFLSLRPPVAVIQPSPLARLFYPDGHAHEWRLAQETPYFLFGRLWGGCTLGGAPQPSPFDRLYLRQPGFRSFIDQAIRAGRLSRDELLGFFQIIQRPGAPSGQERDRRLYPLLLEYSRLHPGPLVSEALAYHTPRGA